MALREELAAQMKQAMKSGERERLRALRLLRAELQVAETSGREVDELGVIKSYANSLRKAAEEYQAHGREDKAEQIRADLAVIEEFLPRQLEPQELERLIDRIIGEQGLGPGDIGAVMRTLMSEHGDVVDGRTAQQIARQRLERR